MKTRSILPSKSFDKGYLLRLLNGNSEMMGVVLNEVYHNIPNCISEIETSFQKNDSIGVVTYANRAKSAFSILREEKLELAFQKIIAAASQGEMSAAREIFSCVSPAELTA